MTPTFDATGAALVADFLTSGAHLRPTDADFARLADSGRWHGELGGLIGQSGGQHPTPKARAWTLDHEGRNPTAHEQLARSVAIAGPQSALERLADHLAHTCPVVLANGFDLDWEVRRTGPDTYKARFHNRQRTLMDRNPEVVARHCGAVFGLLSTLPAGQRTFQVEPGRDVGTQTVVAASPADAAKFWMAMESLDVLRTRPVQPPAWVIEKFSQEDLHEALGGFQESLPDLRITTTR